MSTRVYLSTNHSRKTLEEIHPLKCCSKSLIHHITDYYIDSCESARDWEPRLTEPWCSGSSRVGNPAPFQARFKLVWTRAAMRSNVLPSIHIKAMLEGRRHARLHFAHLDCTSDPSPSASPTGLYQLSALSDGRHHQTYP